MGLVVDVKKKLANFTLESAFEAEPDEILAILGDSGSGKSMTLRCVAGIEKPDEGKIILNGRTLFDSAKKINLKPQERRVGYFFQNYALFPNMTVAKNIKMGIPPHIGNKEEIIRDKISSFYLEGLERKYPDKLSGGQQQRVALARIFASSPEVIMLDEPFSALDSYLRWKMEEELRRILQDFHGEVLLVSHSRDEVYRLCKRVGVIDQGKLQPVRCVKELFDDPSTLAEVLLSGCKNVSEVTITPENQLESKEWGLRLDGGDKVTEEIRYVAIRAHDIEIGTGPRNNVKCQIVQSIEDMFEWIVSLEPVGNKGVLYLKRPKLKGEFYEVGQILDVHLPVEKLMFLKN